MTDPAPIFRREALDFRSGVGHERAALRADSPWTRPLYWLMLMLAVGAVGAGWAVRADATTSGPASLDLPTRTFTALVPVAAGSDVQPGRPVRLRLSGRTLDADVLTVQMTDTADARRAGFASTTGPAVLLTGALTVDENTAGLPASSRQQGRVVVVLRSDRLIHLFLDGVGGLFGKGGDG
jgi:hypothetical protein